MPPPPALPRTAAATASPERTIIAAGDPLEDEEGFVARMDTLAQIGITKVCVMPAGPDLVAWVTRVTERVLPRLREL